jgi:hypothetical protein
MGHPGQSEQLAPGGGGGGGGRGGGRRAGGGGGLGGGGRQLFAYSLKFDIDVFYFFNFFTFN